MAENDRTGNAQDRLAGTKRVVVKVGSALLIDREGALAGDWLASLADDLAGLRRRGAEIIVVTSGAVAIGRSRLGLGGRLRLAEKQAAAAAGQARLIEAWQEALAPHGLVAAQLLLTLDDTENRRRYLNARATLEALLSIGAVPVINENDTVATAEIRYGDNDRLSAHAAQMAGADLLILLSDIDGLYTADPRKDAGAAHIPFVDDISPAIEGMAGGANAEALVGSGGMATKLAAAKIATAYGCAVIIARGDVAHPLRAINEGAATTLFAPHSTPDRARRAWIGGRLKPAGTLTIDAGAASALKRGASLLPAGVTAVEGDFRRGDAVIIVAASGEIIGRGLIAYDAADARRLIGKRSEDIEAILGYRGASAFVHRDDLAIEARARDKD
jgi:glutamate 5-kinase